MAKAAKKAKRATKKAVKKPVRKPVAKKAKAVKKSAKAKKPAARAKPSGKAKKAAKKAVKRLAARKAKTAPKKKAVAKTAPRKKATSKKAAPKKAAPKKATPKKAAPKKAVPKKAAPKKAAPKKAVPKKAAKRKVAKVSRRKAPVKKPPVRTAPFKKAPSRKAAKPPVRVAPPPPKPVKPAPPTPAEKERLKAAQALRETEGRQAQLYGKAVKLFNSKKYSQALKLFVRVAEGPHPSLRHRAGVYVEICRQRLRPSKVRFKTADEYYNYGIQLVNERRLDEADSQFRRALKMQPKAAHVHLAAAVLGALSGDIEKVYKSLKKAIDLDPRSRVLALNDADLSAVVNHPSIAELLHGNSAPGESG